MSISCRCSSRSVPPAEDYKAERLYDGIEMGSLAMDAYRFS